MVDYWWSIYYVVEAEHFIDVDDYESDWVSAVVLALS